MPEESTQIATTTAAAIPAPIPTEPDPLLTVAPETLAASVLPTATPAAQAPHAETPQAQALQAESPQADAPADEDTTVEGESEGDDEATDTPTPPAPMTIPVSPAASAPKDDRSYEQRLPYEWDKCIRLLTIQIWPADGEAEERVYIAGSTHHDLPIVKMAPLSTLLALPAPLQAVLDELRADLPNRAERAQAAEDKKQQAETERQKEIAESKARVAARSKKPEPKKDAKPAAKPKPEPKPKEAKPAPAPVTPLPADVVAKLTTPSAPKDPAAPAANGMTQVSMF